MELSRVLRYGLNPQKFLFLYAMVVQGILLSFSPGRLIGDLQKVVVVGIALGILIKKYISKKIGDKTPILFLIQNIF